MGHLLWSLSYTHHIPWYTYTHYMIQLVKLYFVQLHSITYYRRVLFFFFLTNVTELNTYVDPFKSNTYTNNMHTIIFAFWLAESMSIYPAKTWNWECKDFKLKMIDAFLTHWERIIMQTLEDHMSSLSFLTNEVIANRARELSRKFKKKKRGGNYCYYAYYLSITWFPMQFWNKWALVNFSKTKNCSSIQNLLMLIYSKLHSKSCDYLYKLNCICYISGRMIS